MRRNLLLSALCCCLMAASAAAQPQVPSARYSPLGMESPKNTSPLVQWGAFDYDTQLWAPVDFSDLSDNDLPTGFFLTYDRVYMNIGRPDPIGPNPPAQVPRGSDWYWGNRFFGGFIDDAGRGFQAEYMDFGGIFLSAGPDVLVLDPFLTETNFDRFELNRIFRERLSNGDYLEPYFGLAYTSLSDATIEDTTFFVGATEIPNRFKQDVSNSAIGGQVGARYIAQRGRWNIRTDSALTASYNSQTYESTDIQVTPGQTFPTIFTQTTAANSFIPTVDLQLELAYSLTRDLKLRTTYQLMYMWDGVARANTATTGVNPNSALGLQGGLVGIEDQSLFLGGFGFGLEWRR